MAFTARNTGDKIRAEDVKELQGALDGTAGYGQAISMTNLNSASAYSLTVQNLDSANGLVARFLTSAALTILQLTQTAATFGKKVVVSLGTISDASDAVSISATWNDVADTFNGILVSITNTFSAAASRLLNLKVGGTSVFSVDVSGNTLVAGTLGVTGAATLSSTLGVTGAATLSSTLGVTGASTLDGTAYIGDTANGKCTLGLTINQAGADNEILALKSSDVAHGITDNYETDTYGCLKKTVGASGGLLVEGLTEATIGLGLAARVVTEETAASHARDTASTGAIMLDASLKSGTGVTTLSGDANLVVVRNNTTARFMLDADGDSHQDVGTAWTNFDDCDDVALLTALSVGVSRPTDPIRATFGEFLESNREVLERAKLVQFNDDGHHFVNMSRMSMLMVGAIRQMSTRTELLQAEVAELRRLLPAANTA